MRCCLFLCVVVLFLFTVFSVFINRHTHSVKSGTSWKLETGSWNPKFQNPKEYKTKKTRPSPLSSSFFYSSLQSDWQKTEDWMTWNTIENVKTTTKKKYQCRQPAVTSHTNTKIQTKILLPLLQSPVPFFFSWERKIQSDWTDCWIVLKRGIWKQLCLVGCCVLCVVSPVKNLSLLSYSFYLFFILTV